MKKCITILTITLICLWTISTQATLLTHSTAGTIVEDNFENASEVATGLWNQNDTTDANPNNAILGSTWTKEVAGSGNGVSANRVQVTNYGTPGAYQGSNYLRLHRVSGDGDVATMLYNASKRQTSGTVHLTVMTYFEDTDINTTIELIDYPNSDWWVYSIMVYFQSDGYIYYRSNGSYVNTGIQYVADQWKKTEIIWEIGSDTFTLKYGDTTKNDCGVNDKSLGVTGVLYYGGGEDGSYFDAVPEPATIGLLTVGTLGLFARRH